MIDYNRLNHGLGCSCGGGWIAGHHEGCPELSDENGYAIQAIKADIKEAENAKDYEQVQDLKDHLEQFEIAEKEHRK
jgi:hypothetical protein